MLDCSFAGEYDDLLNGEGVANDIGFNRWGFDADKVGLFGERGCNAGALIGEAMAFTLTGIGDRSTLSGINRLAGDKGRNGGDSDWKICKERIGDCLNGDLFIGDP